jgi:hypothetical protein
MTHSPRTANEAKKSAGWAVIVAGGLLVFKTVGFFQDFHLGWVRALGFYPIGGPEELGYDLVPLAEFIFILWAAYRLMRHGLR